MAARLRKETSAQVQMIRGGLGELSVYLDDQKVIETSAFGYPRPGKIVGQLKQLLAT